MTQRRLKVCNTNNVRINHSPCLHSFNCDVIKMLSVNDMKTSRDTQESLKGEKLRWCLKISSKNCVNKTAKLITKDIVVKSIDFASSQSHQMKTFSLRSSYFPFCLLSFGNLEFTAKINTHIHTKIVSKIKLVNKFSQINFLPSPLFISFTWMIYCLWSNNYKFKDFYT